VHTVPVNDCLQLLKQRIMQACKEITNAQCQSAICFVTDRCNACLRVGSYHFEQNI